MEKMAALGHIEEACFTFSISNCKAAANVLQPPEARGDADPRRAGPSPLLIKTGIVSLPGGGFVRSFFLSF